MAVSTTAELKKLCKIVQYGGKIPLSKIFPNQYCWWRWCSCGRKTLSKLSIDLCNISAMRKLQWCELETWNCEME